LGYGTITTVFKGFEYDIKKPNNFGKAVAIKRISIKRLIS